MFPALPFCDNSSVLSSVKFRRRKTLQLVNDPNLQERTKLKVGTGRDNDGFSIWLLLGCLPVTTLLQMKV